MYQRKDTELSIGIGTNLPGKNNIFDFESCPKKEVNSHPRCVCRLGYFRPPRIPACIPIETFPHFDASNWMDLASEFKSGRLNCSRLISDLSNLYPGIFLYRKGQGRGIGKEQVIARDDPRQEMPTDEGYEPPDFPPKFMFNKDEPEARCDPKNRESCGIGKICAAIGNGTDVWGKCVGKCNFLESGGKPQHGTVL